MNIGRTGIWTDAEDKLLIRARARNEGWSAIASRHFPGKTGNACRKRHERLKKKEGGGNEGDKIESIAKEYMVMREEMWKTIADHCGETWKEVEKIVSPDIHCE